MLIDIDDLIIKYKINVTGVIHVGGHIGEEIPLYKKYTNNIHIFEPQIECFHRIDNSVNKYCIALGEMENVLDFYVANNMQSSSILKPKTHLSEHPDITFNQTRKVKILPLDYFKIQNCNFLNIDVQGYELNVLKGSINTLHSIDYIYTEINNKELYENCTMIDDLDIFLNDFKRVETSYCGSYGWGDAFYIRKKVI